MTTATPVADLLDRVHKIIDNIDYNRVGYELAVRVSSKQEVYVQLFHGRPDAVTHAWKIGKSRPYFIPPTATTSEIVRGVLGVAIAYEEHEVREYFRYRGAQVFGPHIDVEALVEVADRLDA